MRKKNIITNTDSYKFLNNSLFNGVSNIFSYFESRAGAEYPTTVFFGLQYFIKAYLEGVVVTQEKLEQAKSVARYYLGGEDQLNVVLWQTIINEHGGRLPVRIRAVPEGTEVPESNVLMSIELTVDDPRLVGLVNHLETLLTNVWSTCTVATKSLRLKRMIEASLDITADSKSSLLFQLHDFAQRSVKCPEQAATSGLAHLINFLGTDTVLAYECARDYYHADPSNTCFSVFATEHNYMMYRGVDGELEVLREILTARPTGIASIVADTYDIYRFVDQYIGVDCKELILTRDGTVVVRPDSVTPDHPTPAKMVLWILDSLWKNFGGTVNSKGFKVLNPKVRVIYGDSLTEQTIAEILSGMVVKGYSTENVVLGCGSYLLDKHNRDTQRFAYKSSSMKIDGVWKDVYKDPIGSDKTSKKGRLKLIVDDGDFRTVRQEEEGVDRLITVFENGQLVKDWTLDEVRQTVRSYA